MCFSLAKDSPAFGFDPHGNRAIFCHMVANGSFRHVTRETDFLFRTFVRRCLGGLLLVLLLLFVCLVLLLVNDSNVVCNANKISDILPG